MVRWRRKNELLASIRAIETQLRSLPGTLRLDPEGVSVDGHRIPFNEIRRIGRSGPRLYLYHRSTDERDRHEHVFSRQTEAADVERTIIDNLGDRSQKRKQRRL